MVLVFETVNGVFLPERLGMALKDPSHRFTDEGDYSLLFGVSRSRIF